MREGSKFIIMFVVFTLLGIMAFYWNKDGTSFGWEIYTVIGTASTLALAILAVYGYLKYRKEEEIIDIVFMPKPSFQHEKLDENGYLPTGLTVLRQNCTRSEIQGLLGMIFNDYHGRHRYDLEDFLTNKGDILKIIDNAKTGKDNKVIIKITEEELKQFNILV